MASDPAVPLHGSGPDAAIASAPEPRRRRWFAVRAPAGEAIRTLRLLLLGSILAPLLVLLGGSYVGYKTTVDHARTDLIETVAIAEENVIKVLDTHALVAARVSDLLGGLSDEAIRAREKELHDSLRLQIADLPQVETAWAVDRTGHLLVGARNFPSGSLDLSDRDYFRALREPGPEIYISGLQSRFDNKPFFAVARRRVGRTRASILGEWAGVILSHLYFGVPATVGLVLLCLVALRHTRREGEAIAQAREAMAQREAAEAQLRQAQKMEALGQLTSGIAHDFNNLLTAILGNVELLQRRVRDRDPELLRLAGAAMRGVDRAATLTQRLLAFSRRQPLDPKPLEVNRLIAGMSDLLRRTLAEEIEPETVLAGGLWPVLVDANQLEHSLLNLAINARDAMASGGKLTIETANTLLDESYAARHEELAPGQYVMISVSDTGSGMSAEVREKAFEPFFTTKETGQGTGLGLSQVYGFIKQSGGHCAIYSEPGQGTTVRLYLPRHLGDVQTVGLPESRRAGSGRGEMILFVEDDADVRIFATDLLRELGYDVLAAATGMEGLSLLEAHPEVRLLFTDVALPGGMTGRQLADQAVQRHPGLKVLYTTGYARNAIVHQGRLDPGVELIVKPFTSAALAGRIRQLLDAA